MSTIAQTLQCDMEKKYRRMEHISSKLLEQPTIYRSFKIFFAWKGGVSLPGLDMENQTSNQS